MLAKLKPVLIFFLLLSLTGLSQEQFQKYWRFQSITKPNFIGQSVIDSSLLVGGTVRTGTDINDAFISKWDQQGTFLWAKKLDNPNNYQFTRVYSILELQNGNLFCFIRISGYDALVAMLSPSGQMIWNKRINCLGFGSAMLPDGALETKDSAIVVYGSAYCQGENRYGFVIKLDLVGNIIWDLRLKSRQGAQANQGEGVTDLIETNKGTYFVTSWGEFNEVYFFELDQNSGQVLQSAGFSHGSGGDVFGIEALTNKAGGYDVLVRTPETSNLKRGFGILKLDTNLQLLNAYNYTHPNQYISANNLMHDKWGNCYVYSSRRNHNGTFNANMSIARIDKNGNLIWHKQFPNLSNHGWDTYPKGAIMGLSQRVVFMGYANNPWALTAAEIRVADRLGHYLCDTVPTLQDTINLNRISLAPRSFSADFFTTPDSLNVSNILPEFDTTNCFCSETAEVSDSLYYCIGDTVKVQSSGGFNHTWWPQVGLSCYNCPEPLVFSDTSITYQVITDPGTACEVIHQVKVTVNPLPGPDISGLANRDTLCEGQTLTLSPNVNNYDSLRWNTGDTTMLLTIDSIGLYHVVAYRHGCVDFDTIDVAQSPMPILITPNDTSICYGDTITLVASGVGKIIWGDTLNVPAYQVSQTSQYYVVQIENYCGEIIDSVFVRDLGCNCEFTKPNVFTPNGDFQHDVFRLESNCEFQKSSLEIYNRWGQLVYSSNEELPSWDGSSSTGPQPDGVYFYQFTGHTLSAQASSSGFFHLIR